MKDPHEEAPGADIGSRADAVALATALLASFAHAGTGMGPGWSIPANDANADGFRLSAQWLQVGPARWQLWVDSET